MMKISVKRPMLLCGVILSICSAFAGRFGIYYLIICIPIVLIFSFCLYNKKIFLIIFFVILLFLSSFLHTSYKISKLRNFCFSSYNLNLIAVEKPVIEDNYGQVKVLSQNNGKISDDEKFILYFNNSLPVEAGDIISVTVKMQPLDNTDNKLYYYSNNIYFKLKLVSFEGTTQKSTFYSTMNNVRNLIEDKLFLNLSRDTAPTMCAITYGDDSYISDSFALNIRRSGVSHVMVVSGMHLAIIMNGIFALLDRLFYNRYLRCLLSVICVFLICGICGFTMSITRAAIMYVLAAFAPLLFRENDSVNTLGTTVAIIIITSPYAIFNISFLLSVTATYGVIGLSPFYSELFAKRIHKENFVLRGAVSLVCNTLCAMIMTLPITIYCFSEVSLIAPLTNLAITYPVTWGLTLTFYALILSFIPYLSFVANLLFKFVDFFVKYINIIINDFGSYKYSAITVNKNFAILAIALIVFLIVFMYFKEYKGNSKIEKGEKNVSTV